MNGYHQMGILFSKIPSWWYAMFLRHPSDTNYSYFGHLKHSWYLGFSLLKGSSALFIHGIFPSWFEHTGSTIIREANQSLPMTNKAPGTPKSLTL